MARITPKYRRETAEAWALGVAGGLVAVTELGSELGKEGGAKTAKVVGQGLETLRRLYMGREAGAAAVSMTTQHELLTEPSQDQLATVIQLRPGIVSMPPSELPLEAA